MSCKNQREIGEQKISVRTYRTRKRFDSIISLARKLEADPERDQRIQKGLCIVCHYSAGNRLAGAAMTERPCLCCGAVQVYGSTDTDMFCLSCAQENALCKHCGANINFHLDQK